MEPPKAAFFQESSDCEHEQDLGTLQSIASPTALLTPQNQLIITKIYFLNMVTLYQLITNAKQALQEYNELYFYYQKLPL